eukprot:GFKZ01002960.1.p1 GENE.GFKZ01002960.1~~GFKZ01002960.1.p1  ORF type:complete len:438 (-),score=66.65 GFKZ01002960.1:2062-3375(-)
MSETKSDSNTSKSSIRHQTPQNMSGWLLKEGKRFRSRYRRYLILKAGMLSSHHSETSPASWQVRLADCPFQGGPRQNELIIKLQKRSISYFAHDQDSYQQWVAALRSSSSSRVDDFYKLGTVLGEGAFAKVRMAIDKQTGQKTAVKIIEKHGHDPREMEYLSREMDIMKSVSHPNVVNTIDMFDSPGALHIVLEYMAGGELFDIIADAGSFTEQKAAQVTRDLIKGVQYLHMHDIVHRDLKPENVLCVTKSWPLEVKIADFGLADFSRDGVIDTTTAAGMIGTPGYVAPEVVNKVKYGPAVDMWAVGVLLYIMLSGKMPFYGKNDRACLEMIAKGRYSMPLREWSQISEDAKSLVRGLLQLDPNKRLTANAALHHKWLADPNAQSSSPINNDLSGIHSSRRKFRKAVMATMTVGRIATLASGTTPGEDEGKTAHKIS